MAVALLICALWAGAGMVSRQAVEQGAVSLRAAVLEAAMQCYAIEGAYPPNLEYLQDNYGLVVNRQSYAITYEAFASNVMPAVKVVPK